MAKRFVDTDLWQKEWYQDLSLKEKLLVRYIFESCDCAGVWSINFKLASFIIGEAVTMDDINKINSKKQQFTIFSESHIYVDDFIKFQYGTLSENCKPHKPIIEKLKKYGLFETLSKGFQKGLQNLEEKEEEEEEQEKEKEKEKESNTLYGEYSNVSLSKEQHGKLLAMCASEKLLDELINSFSVQIEVGKERPYTAELPNAHFERLKAYYNYRRKNPDKFKTKEERAPDDFWAEFAKKYEGRPLVV
nr:MAG TPA: hypothetical protein [Caudoviricetes sp.]